MRNPKRAQRVLAVLILALGLPLSGWADSPARPARPGTDLALRRAIRQAVVPKVRAMRAQGRSGAEIRGEVQRIILDQVQQRRVGLEQRTLRRAGLKLKPDQVRAFVNQDMQHAISTMDRSGWDGLSTRQQFGATFRNLERSFVGKRTSPARIKGWVAAKRGSGKATAVEAMLGQQLPKVTYYGQETAKAAHNFQTTGTKVAPDMIHALAQVKLAAAYTNMRTGRLDRKKAFAIMRAAKEVAQGKFDDQFITDAIQGGAGTSTNMNVNEVIAGRASELLTGKVDHKTVNPLDHVNMAQSTNDVYPTAARIAVHRRLQRLLGALDTLSAELKHKGKSFNGIPSAGRTHLQDAVPVDLGARFKAYATQVSAEKTRIRQAMGGLLSVNMGATAVGNRLNADPAYVKQVTKVLGRVTGLKLRRSRDLMAATSSAAALQHAQNTLNTTAGTLNQICNDLRLMASGPRSGLGEIRLPAVQKGSSIMPGKVNPVMPEALNQACMFTMGNTVTATAAATAGQLQLNQFEPVLINAVLSSARALETASRGVALGAIRGCQANAQACRTQAAHMAGTVTAVSPLIGYKKAAELANYAVNNNLPIKKAAVQGGFLTPAQANRYLDPARVAKGGLVARP